MENIPTLEMMATSRIARDDNENTLPQATLDELTRQREANLFTPTLETYWNVNDTQYTKLLTVLQDTLPIRFGYTDYRIRPDSMLNPSEVWTDKEIADRIDWLKNELNECMFPATNKIEHDRGLNDQEKMKSNIKRFENLKQYIVEWKPIRMIRFHVYMNYHDIDKIVIGLENLESVNIFYKQLKTIINLRKEAMDEINKNRSNPIRSIHFDICIKPSELYVCASWDIHRSYQHGFDYSYNTYSNNITEYNISGIDVILFKSKATLQGDEAIKQEQNNKEIAKKEKQQEKERKQQEKERKQQEKERKQATPEGILLQALLEEKDGLYYKYMNDEITRERWLGRRDEINVLEKKLKAKLKKVKV